jgi:hypothetical protein
MTDLLLRLVVENYPVVDVIHPATAGLVNPEE